MRKINVKRETQFYDNKEIKNKKEEEQVTNFKIL